MDSKRAQIVREGLRFLVKTLGAERALVLLEGDVPGALVVEGTHGIQSENLWLSGQISVEILRRVMDEGAPEILSDAIESHYGGRTSVLVSGIRSVLCVPMKEPSGRVVGMLYADCQWQTGAFSTRDLNHAFQVVRDFERRLYPPDRAAPSVHAPAPAPAPAPPPPSLRAWWAARWREIRGRLREPVQPRTASAKQRAVFFRSLSLMFQSGVTIGRALELVGQQSDSPVLARAAQDIARAIQRGMSLSRAMGRHAGVFSELELRLIEVGCVTGELEIILARLADYDEKLHSLALKTRAALTYPAFLLTASLALVMFLPPMVFGDFLEVIAQMGVAVPWPTRVVLFVSDTLRSPWFFVAAGALAGLAWTFGRRLWQRLEVRRAYTLGLLSIAGVGPSLRILAVTRFARALQISVNAGVPLLQGLQLAGQASDNPVLAEGVTAVLAQFLEGDTLDQSLAAAGFFPPLFLQSVMVGEQTGSLPRILTSICDLYDVELDHRLECLTAMAEPFIMVLMGAAVGFIVIATMLPLMRVIQDL